MTLRQPPVPHLLRMVCTIIILYHNSIIHKHNRALGAFDHKNFSCTIYKPALHLGRKVCYTPTAFRWQLLLCIQGECNSFWHVLWYKYDNTWPSITQLYDAFSTEKCTGVWHQTNSGRPSIAPAPSVGHWEYDAFSRCCLSRSKNSFL